MVVSPVHFPLYRFWSRSESSDSFFDSTFYFRRGSWALAHGLLALAKKRKKESLTVWFPDYFCREPLEIVKRFPITIAFYPVTKKLIPDWEALRRMAKVNVPDALVLVHYFGFANDIEGATIFCNHYNIDLVEDCAHVARPYGSVGKSGAMSIWSPWKFFPVPELGMLWVRDELRGLVDAPKPHREVLPFIQWWAKREVERVLCALGVHWYRRKSSLPLGRGAGGGASPHILSLRLFQRFIHSANSIYERRIKNYRILGSFFKERYPEMVLTGILSNGVVPYAFPCVTSKPASVLSKAFVARGIPAFPWPDLPDEVKKNSSRYPWAHFYADHLLLFPVHQNISTQAMRYIQQSLTALIVRPLNNSHFCHSRPDRESSNNNFRPISGSPRSRG